MSDELSKPREPFLDLDHCRNSYELMRLANERNLKEKQEALARIAILESQASQFESTIKETMRVRDEKIKLLEEAIEGIRILIADHQLAYSIDIFPYSVDMNQYDPIVRNNVSAAMGRHMCKVFEQYIDQAFASARQALKQIEEIKE